MLSVCFCSIFADRVRLRPPKPCGRKNSWARNHHGRTASVRRPPAGRHPRRQKADSEANLMVLNALIDKKSAASRSKGTAIAQRSRLCPRFIRLQRSGNDEVVQPSQSGSANFDFTRGTVRTLPERGLEQSAAPCSHSGRDAGESRRTSSRAQQRQGVSASSSTPILSTRQPKPGVETRDAICPETQPMNPCRNY